MRLTDSVRRTAIDLIRSVQVVGGQYRLYNLVISKIYMM